jgi:hypothetical protein
VAVQSDRFFKMRGNVVEEPNEKMLTQFAEFKQIGKVMVSAVLLSQKVCQPWGLLQWMKRPHLKS